MIKSVTGNLLEDNAQALVNTVNTVGVMGKGIALQFREAFPDNYNIYRHACKSKELVIGKMLITQENTLNGSKIIINFPTKTTWRRPSEYIYIREGLITLRSEIISRKIKSIAIPPLGTHNGGLDWTVVRKMIEEALGDLDCDIRLYEPSKIIIDKLKTERVKFTPARAILLDVMCDMVSYGEFASVFAAEKIVYFLQRLGAADIFRIKFTPYIYGPYSGGKIAHVLYYLNGSYIKGMGGMETKPFQEIWLMDDTRKVVLEYLNREGNEKYKSISNKAKDFLKGFYSQYSLELLASVDYILCNDKTILDAKDYQVILNKVNEKLASWNSHKKNLFVGSKHVDKVLNFLLNDGRLKY